MRAITNSCPIQNDVASNIRYARTLINPWKYALLLVPVLCIAIVPPAQAQSPVITPAVSIDQQMLEQGKYPIRKVLESGGQFFSTPYLPYDAASQTGDGYGEGPMGPRAAQRNAFYPQGFPDDRFLRLNGLDSQSCYECHNSIGSYVEPGTQSTALIRKPGTVGGSGGSNSNAFINPKFPQPLALFIRNPPHIFGTGYIQSLAQEITHDLAAQRAAARIVAMNKGLNMSVTVPLSSKGLDFGKFTTTYTNGPAKVTGAQDVCAGQDPNSLGEAGYTDDVSQVAGVSSDLICRPLQWKGVASSIRHFVRDATDFHFSMQAVEKVGLGVDGDLDGKVNEMTVGNVSALSSFAGTIRPPQMATPSPSAQRGQQIFLGTATGATLSGQMCANCHVASLTLNDPTLAIIEPTIPTPQAKPKAPVDIVTPANSAQDLDVVRIITPRLTQAIADNKSKLTGTDHKTLANLLQPGIPQAPAANRPPGYYINLTNPGADVPTSVNPRLPANANQTVSVPLFSDLRRHRMGDNLADTQPQGSDVANICIPNPLFLTRPLWGVADTGPWLHDGRATTLKDAILQHAGNNSEANDVIKAFHALSVGDQQAVVDFLLTMQLPIDPGITATNQGK